MKLLPNSAGRPVLAALSLVAWAAGPVWGDVIFDGVDYTAQGAANLVVADDQIRISNLDSSGTSGFTAETSPVLRFTYAQDFDSSRSNKARGIKVDQNGEPVEGPGLVVTRGQGTDYSVTPDFRALQPGSPIIISIVLPNGHLTELHTMLKPDLQATFTLPEAAPQRLTHEFATFRPEETGEIALANDSARVLFPQPVEVTIEGRTFVASGIGFATRLNSVDCGPLLGVENLITINEGEGGCSVTPGERENGFFMDGSHGVDSKLPILLSTTGPTLPQPTGEEQCRRLSITKRIDKSSPLLARAAVDGHPVTISIQGQGRFFGEGKTRPLGRIEGEATGDRLRLTWDGSSLPANESITVELYSDGNRIGSETLPAGDARLAVLRNGENAPTLQSSLAYRQDSQSLGYQLLLHGATEARINRTDYSIDELRVIVSDFDGSLDEVKGTTLEFDNLAGDIVFTPAQGREIDKSSPKLAMGAPRSLTNLPAPAATAGHFVPGHVTVLKRAELPTGGASTMGENDLVLMTLENGVLLPTLVRLVPNPSTLVFEHALPVEASNASFDITQAEQKTTARWTSKFPQLLPTRPATVTVGKPVERPTNFNQALPARSTTATSSAKLITAENNRFILEVDEDAPNRATVDLHAAIVIGEGDDARMVTVISEDTNGACYGGPGEWLKLIGDIFVCSIEQLVDLEDFQIQVTDDGHVTVLKRSTNQPVPLTGTILVNVKDQAPMPQLDSALIPRDWNAPNQSIFVKGTNPDASLRGGSMGMPDGSGGLIATSRHLDKSSPMMARALNFTGNQGGIVLAPNPYEVQSGSLTDLTLRRVETDIRPWLAAVPGVIPLGMAIENHGLGFPGQTIQLPAQPATPGVSVQRGYRTFSSVQRDGELRIVIPNDALVDDMVVNIDITEATALGVQCPDPLIPDCVLIEDYSAVSSGQVLFSGENTAGNLQLRIPEIIRCGFPGWNVRLVEGDGNTTTFAAWRMDTPLTTSGSQMTVRFSQLSEKPGDAPLSLAGESAYDIRSIMKAAGLNAATHSVVHNGTMLHNVATIGDQLITRAGITARDGDSTTTTAGHARTGYIYPTVGGLVLPHPGNGFIGRSSRQSEGSNAIQKAEGESDENVTYFLSETDADGTPEPCITLDGEWCDGSMATLEACFEMSNGQIITINVPDILFEQAGSLEECAAKLKDIGACGGVQLNGGSNGVGWDCETLPDGRVKLFAYPLLADVTMTGKINLCVSCPREIDIVSVTQKDCFAKGDEICFEMTGISPEPDTLCVMLNTSPPIPLDVIDILPTGSDGVFKVTAIITGAPDALTTAQICVASGVGVTQQWSPMANISVDEPGFSWFGLTNDPAKSTEVIVLKPNDEPPAPTEICLFDEITGDETALCFDFNGPYPEGTQVKVSGHLYITSADGSAISYDIQEPLVTTLAGSTADDMCTHFMDVIRCQLATAGFIPDLELKCPDDGDNDPNTATFKICYNGVDGVFSGYLKIILCLPGEDPVVDGTDTDGPVDNDDTVVITGCNFGDEAKNIHVLAVGPQGSFPLTVLMASDKEIVVSTGTIPADLAGQNFDLQVTVGHGVCRPIALPADLELATPAGGFSNPGGGNTSTLAGGLSTVQSPAIDPNKVALISTQSIPGQIELVVNIPWDGAMIASVDFHGYVNNDPTQVVALHIPRIDFPAGGTTEQCLATLAQAIASAMTQTGLTPNLNLGYSTSNNTIYLSNPGAPTLEPLTGKMTVCIEKLPPRPIITAVPETVTFGQPFLIEGSFEGKAEDYVAFIRSSQGHFTPIRIDEITEQGLVACGQDNDCDGGDDDCNGIVYVGFGTGSSKPARFAYDGLFTGKRGASSIHLPSGDRLAASPTSVAVVTNPEEEAKRRFRGDLVDGKFCLFLRGDWTGDEPISIALTARTECDTFSFFADEVTLGGDGSALDCAERLKDVIRCAFVQQTGVGLVVECEPIANSNTVKLTFCLESQKPLLEGGMIICTALGEGGPDADPDGDGLTNAQEENNNTSPTDADSDNDGLLDGQEIALGTNPLRPDSDGDGTTDGGEIIAGTNPNDASSKLALVLDGIDNDCDGDVEDDTCMPALFCIPQSVEGVIYELKTVDLTTGTSTKIPGMVRIGNGGDVFFDVMIENAQAKDFFIVTAR